MLSDLDAPRVAAACADCDVAGTVTGSYGYLRSCTTALRLSSVNFLSS